MSIGTFIKLTSVVLVFTASHSSVASLHKGIDRRGMSVNGETVKSPKLDKTGTKGVAEKKNDSQVPVTKALTSRVSFGAERTGYVFDVFVTLCTHGSYDASHLYVIICV